MSLSKLLGGLLLTIPGMVLADQGDLPLKTSGPYLGIGGGYSQIDTRDGNVSVSGDSISYRLFGGYRFAHLPLPFDMDLGLEIGYADLGKVDETVIGSNIEVELTSLITSGIIYLPINRHWDVFGKVGAYFWDGKVLADGVQTSDETDTALSYGLGVAMQTGGAFGAQFEIESIDALDGVWVATLSATWQFK